MARSVQTLVVQFTKPNSLTREHGTEHSGLLAARRALPQIFLIFQKIIFVRLSLNVFLEEGYREGMVMSMLTLTVFLVSRWSGVSQFSWI